jgi:hypothetical protein
VEWRGKRRHFSLKVAEFQMAAMERIKIIQATQGYAKGGADKM